MNKTFHGVLLLGLLIAAPVAAEPVDAILAHQRAHGYSSPLAGLERLRAADDVPGPSAPLESRRRYHAALLELALEARRSKPIEVALSDLAALARNAACAKCHVDELIGRAAFELQSKAVKNAEAHLTQAETLLVDDKEQRMRLLAARTSLDEAKGSTASAIETAVNASTLALELGDTARHIRMLGTMAGTTPGSATWAVPRRSARKRMHWRSATATAR